MFWAFSGAPPGSTYTLCARDRVPRFRATRGGLFARRDYLPPAGSSYEAVAVSRDASGASRGGPAWTGPSKLLTAQGGTACRSFKSAIPPRQGWRA